MPDECIQREWNWFYNGKERKEAPANWVSWCFQIYFQTRGGLYLSSSDLASQGNVSQPGRGGNPAGRATRSSQAASMRESKVLVLMVSTGKQKSMKCINARN